MTKKTLIIYCMLTIVMFAFVWFAVEKSIWSTGDSADRMIPIDGPLIANPQAVPVDDAKVKDESQVVGIVHNGKARAYVLSSMTDKTQHVVNDLIGGKPFALTYCDLNDCVKVYTNPEGNAPLNVTVGGWMGTNAHGALILRVGSMLYNQSTGQSISSEKTFPFPTVNFERMTWKEWKAKYPNSDVYYQNTGKKTSTSIPNL
ncbi:MAG: DUF3179 domain-containing (seleno)protein [Gemmataceae bacterium]